MPFRAAGQVPPTRAGRPWRRWLVLLLVCTLLVSACARPQGGRRTFVGSSGDPPVSHPKGLNPLGDLDTCVTGRVWDEGSANRVLVSPPEYFTEEASLMISSLRESLAREAEGLPAPQFLMAPQPIFGPEMAAQEGQRCGAMIVLWEPPLTFSLWLVLPRPEQVPLRNMVRGQLCEFGSHSEQLQILYWTIAGLLSLREYEYDRAVNYMTLAHEMDTRCLNLEPPKDPAP